MYRFVADRNDEQVIAMFVSQTTKGEKKERAVRNSDAHLIYVRCRE